MVASYFAELQIELERYQPSGGAGFVVETEERSFRGVVREASVEERRTTHVSEGRGRGVGSCAERVRGAEKRGHGRHCDYALQKPHSSPNSVAGLPCTGP